MQEATAHRRCFSVLWTQHQAELFIPPGLWRRQHGTHNSRSGNKVLHSGRELLQEVAAPREGQLSEDKLRQKTYV